MIVQGRNESAARQTCSRSGVSRLGAHGSTGVLQLLSDNQPGWRGVRRAWYSTYHHGRIPSITMKALLFHPRDGQYTNAIPNADVFAARTALIGQVHGASK